jgi:Uma2 family endonuclease
VSRAAFGEEVGEDCAKIRPTEPDERSRSTMAAELKDLPRPHYTLEEYFALEEASEARYEYWDGEIVCMSGGTEHHYIISDNLHAQL